MASDEMFRGKLDCGQKARFFDKENCKEGLRVKLQFPIAIIEKDYYVTMILRELAKRTPEWNLMKNLSN